MSSRMSVETVAPDQARRWLLTSTQNKLDLNRVRKIIRRVQNGEWDPTISKYRQTPILIKAGVLSNGHHRLITILILDESLPMLVKYQ